MIIAILIIVLLALVGCLLVDSFVEIPAYHFGVVERFGRRTGRIMDEGLRMKWPFIDRVELISMELVEIDIPVNFTTKDKLQLTCNGSLQYRPDPAVERDGRCVFVEMSEEIIKSGISDTIKAKLGALGGVKKGADFIILRHAIADMLNCFFRLERPPHKDHEAGCGIRDCNLPNGNEINAEKLLDFYKYHWAEVKSILDEERNNQTRSEVETRYGIDIEYYALASIDFSSDTMKAFEKQKQAEARANAFKSKIKMAKQAQELGASAQVALNSADISLDPSVEKKVVSVEGDVGVLGGLIAAITKGKGGGKDGA